jgi:RHS repeat-associated protein
VCDGPAYRYDADGQLLWDGATGEQLMGDLFRWRSWSLNAFSSIVAFGEVVAEARQVNSSLRAVWAPVGWPLPIPKGPLLRMLAVAAVLTWVALLAWLGVWRAFSEAPATATLVLALTTLLVVPPPAWACRKGGKNCGGGGGRGTETTVRAFFRDHLGSAAYVTGPNVRQVYEPFGRLILTATGAKDEFTGKEFYGATDMYYFGARWYDAEAGRFAGVDPLVANPRDPQGLNAYSYVRNDPVNLIDPSGMMEEITITGTRGSGYSPWTAISAGSLSMGISRPRFAIAVVGGGLYIAADGYLTGALNSQEQEECCGDQNEGGDSADGGGQDEDQTIGSDSIAGVAFDLLIQDLGRRQALERIEDAEKATGRKLSLDEKLGVLFEFSRELQTGILSLKLADAALGREVAGLNKLGFPYKLLAIPRALRISKERDSIQRGVAINALKLRGVGLARAQVLGKIR